MKRSLWLVLAGASVMAMLSGCAGTSPEPVTSQTLLTQESLTVLNQEFGYPVTDSPEVSSSIVTLQPGAETGGHLHEAPMYAYILEGTLDVTYDVDGSLETKTFTTGDAIMEGLNIPHNGKNTSNRPVSALVVNFGSPDLENTVKIDR